MKSTYKPIRLMKKYLLPLLMFFCSLALKAQTIYFNQNFNTATSSSQVPFENATAPNIGQFNDITNALITATGEKYLKFIGNGSTCRAVRSTEFSPKPTTLYVQFSVRASSIGANNSNAFEFYFGDGPNFNNSTAVPTSPSLTLRFGVSLPTNLVVQGGSISATAFSTVTIFINNDVRSMTYNDGTRSGNVPAKKYDLYLGNSLVKNDETLNNTTGNLTKFKFMTRDTLGTPTLDLDNILIKNDFVTLPVELTYFKAQISESQNVALTWETASEINSDYFLVEKSRDAVHYQTLTKVSAAGKSFSKKTYQIVDENPWFGTTYYRLQQIDKDGEVQVFRPQSIVISDEKIPFGVFPNPVFGNDFNLKTENVDEVEVKMLSLEGKEIPINKVKQTETVLKVFSPETITSGVYFLEVKTLGSFRKHKFLIMK